MHFTLVLLHRSGKTSKILFNINITISFSRLPSHADYLSAAATAQRLGELQQAAQASLDVPFSLEGESIIIGDKKYFGVVSQKYFG